MLLSHRPRLRCLLALALLLSLLVACAANNQFKADVWQRSSGTDHKDNTRCQMVHDLMDNHLRVGMSRMEVKDLLGDLTEEAVVNVTVGVCDFGVDYYYLTLTFDEAGRLQDFRLVQG